MSSLLGILSTGHYMLYYLTPAIQPRMLVTFDEALQPVSVSVRVGQVRLFIIINSKTKIMCHQAVDVVGQAGKPKSITGFQTHTTPVLLAHGERAELATEECKTALCKLNNNVLSTDVSLTPIMEGFVILKKNPSYVED